MLHQAMPAPWIHGERDWAIGRVASGISQVGGTPKNAEVAKLLRMSEERLHTIDRKIMALQAMRADPSRLADTLKKTKGLVCPAARK